MKKTVFVIACFVTLIITSVAFTTSNPPLYKNLKILPKDISKEGLDSVMHNFNSSLGVRCGFCHVRNEEKKSMDFASDDKPEKLIARKMMLMTYAINKNYFPAEKGATKEQASIQTITCYTCHKGQEIPAAFISDSTHREHGNEGRMKMN